MHEKSSVANGLKFKKCQHTSFQKLYMYWTKVTNTYSTPSILNNSASAAAVSKSSSIKFNPVHGVLNSAQTKPSWGQDGDLST
jgi:hypothetical protein